jgi:hypothetical protein
MRPAVGQGSLDVQFEFVERAQRGRYGHRDRASRLVVEGVAGPYVGIAMFHRDALKVVDRLEPSGALFVSPRRAEDLVEDACGDVVPGLLLDGGFGAHVFISRSLFLLIASCGSRKVPDHRHAGWPPLIHADDSGGCRLRVEPDPR